MKFTITRINALLAYYSMPTLTPNLFTRCYEVNGIDANIPFTKTPTHDILDVVDRHSGIRTRFDIKGALAPVGARLRRLERHVKSQQSPPYFWLGAQATSECAT